MITIQVITLFPEMFAGVVNSSMLWKAQKNEVVRFRFVNLRDFGLGPRRQVDDTPYGGGDGMLLRIEPLKAALDDALSYDGDAISLLMTPRGKLWEQGQAKHYAAAGRGLILICGRYEGYDERITNFVDGQISIGNFILTGGELPAMVIIDSVVRLLPGVLGGANSAAEESFSHGGNLEYPQYTRPEDFAGLKVPPILLSGNHAAIKSWRDEQSGSQHIQ